MQNDDRTNPARPATEHLAHVDGFVDLPVPTAWPMVLALGATLLIMGMMTHWVISLLGALLMVRSSVGWFFEVLPHELHMLKSLRFQLLALRDPSCRSGRSIASFCRLKHSVLQRASRVALLVELQ